MGTFKYEETTTKKRVIVLPLEKCLQCGKTDVTTFDCGYSSFNVCGVSCNGCDRKVSKTGDYTKRELIEYWNSLNGNLSDSQKLTILRKQLKDLGKPPLV